MPRDSTQTTGSTENERTRENPQQHTVPSWRQGTKGPHVFHIHLRRLSNGQVKKAQLDTQTSTLSCALRTYPSPLSEEQEQAILRVAFESELGCRRIQAGAGDETKNRKKTNGQPQQRPGGSLAAHLREVPHLREVLSSAQRGKMEFLSAIMKLEGTRLHVSGACLRSLTST